MEREGAVWIVSLTAGALLCGILLTRLVQAYRRRIEAETLRTHASRLEADVERRTHELVQTRTMQAVALLAGSVAHDFNNVLTVVIGRTQLLRHRPGIDERTQRDVGLILDAADGGCSLTRQLRALSGRQSLDRRLLDLNGVVADTRRRLPAMIGEHIDVVVTPATTPAWVNGDRAQLEQSILNLVVNARDAMPDGGRLSVTTSRANGRVEIIVSDTGIGMDAATQQRIFEPFFTTKAVGKGAGLGLSIVYGIVRQHDGRITVDSAVGRGSTFRILLPEADPSAGQPEGTAPVTARFADRPSSRVLSHA